MKKLILTVLLILVLSGCSKDSSSKLTIADDISYEIKVDNLDNTELNAILYYQIGIAKSSKKENFYWKDKVVYNQSPTVGGFGGLTYPEDSFKKLVELGKKQGLFDNLQPMELDEYYCNERYEVFVGTDNERSELYFLIDGELKSLYLELDTKESFHILDATDSTLVCGGEIIYNIDIESMAYRTIKLPSMSPNLIDNNMFYGAYIKDNIMNINQYNANTDESKALSIQVDNIVRLEKLAKLGDTIVALCTEDETYKPILLYFDTDFNVRDIKRITASSEYNYVSYYEGRSFKQYGDKLYGTFGVDGKRINELVIIDIPTGELLFQAEIFHKKKKGRYLANITFIKEANDKLITLPQFDISGEDVIK
ncbi:MULTISPECIES: hypothetical protein [unclassified Sedimentibacter]|uniref:hypothetical protein n=1 Tax=unclassified Sedimentibacter TaxID=2649220 RepID=UPI0027DFB5CB|nr:hypothetical protein [Sedimentibacter sp. MB35-C1]WMJ77467.1 hypothetical protein RBQ61_00620 [Sedimentibacter sp. MB35-C1]